MKCENCNSEITFWMTLKQSTPFRFKCSVCKAKYKVSTPRMKTIFLAIVLLFAGLAIGLDIGTEKFGIVFATPFILLMVSIWLLLEVWTNRYISKYGKFTRK